MHDLRDSQTGRLTAKHDRSMRTKRPSVDYRSPNRVQPDGTIPKQPNKRPFTPKRKAAPSK